MHNRSLWDPSNRQFAWCTRAATALAKGALLALPLACAETNAPLPEPVETLIVVNAGSATLSIIPVDAPGTGVEVPLGALAGAPTGVSARDSVALVTLGVENAVAVVDLRARAVLRTVALPSGSGATGSAIVSDSIGYVANPGLNTLTRVNLWTGETLHVPTGSSPQGIVFVRGRLFVLNDAGAASGVLAAPATASWVTVFDPATNARASGIDSIPLTGHGSAKFADVGSDGMLYIVSAGTSETEGRLSIVDPVARTEIASFAGFGKEPGNPASDGDERIFVSSRGEGLMAFDIRTRSVTRGAGSGVAVPANSAVAVDSRGRVYAVESGDCPVGNVGVAHVLDRAFVEIRTIPLGGCAIAAAVVKVPVP